MHGFYFTKDLFFASRVTAAARALGAELRVIGAVDEMAKPDADEEYSLVLLDLDTPGADPAAVVAEARKSAAAPPAVVAFGSHIHEARLEAARQAGCDLVLTRGQFDRQANDILRQYLGE
ncbi:MAG: histidine kinase [Planctomycetes bacterium]|nr:histidine kinase [Planctomycetota bacterium]